MLRFDRRFIMSAWLAFIIGAAAAHATVIYSEDFEVDPTAQWQVNKSTGANANDAASNANFFFDYSTVGIPLAPHSTGTTTRGLMLEANIPGAGSALFSGLSVSPLVSPLVGHEQDDFTIRFDAWLNSIGPFPAGGTGSTQVTGWGWGTAGTTVQWAGGTQDSVHFGATAEGGSSVDYRAYSSAAATGYLPASNVFAAGTGTAPDSRNENHPYYAGLGGKTPPQAQADLFPTQTGSTTTGSAGLAWRDVVIKKQGDTLSWSIDDRLIATVPLTGLTLGGTNILFNHFDINATKATDPNHLIFGLIDNVVIDVIVPAPTITQQPAHQTPVVDQPAAFTVKAKSNLPNLPTLHFEWFKTLNGNTTSQGSGDVTGPDSGVFTSTLNIASADFVDSGAQFYVVITDERPGTLVPTTSNNVFLTVLPLPCNDPFANADGDLVPGLLVGDADQDDFGMFQACFTGETSLAFDPAHCGCFDRDGDSDVDSTDLAAFLACSSTSGPAIAADPSCDDYPTGNVVINEFAYDMFTIAGADAADDREFIELYNAGDTPVDISGWLVRTSDEIAPFPGPTGDDNPDYKVPGGPGSGTTVLAPHGYYVMGTGGIANVNQIIGTTDLFENSHEAVQLMDSNGQVKDTLIYERNSGAVAIGEGEGSYWGNNVFIVGTNMAISRYIDGRDSNNNGRDFGILPLTPGASNSGTLPLLTAYAPPNVDSETNGASVAGLAGSFVNALVIEPADTTLQVGANDVNPNVIPASPQGGKCIVAWDPSGGGNAVYATGLMTGDGSYDLYVYFDTADITEAGAESTSYGIMGTTEPLYNLPDPDGNFFGDIATANGNTGIAWIFNKNNAGQNKKLFLVDAGAGGDSSGDEGSATPRSWKIIQTLDMSAVPSGWHRLSLAYAGATGAVVAKFDNSVFNFTTAPNLVGQFYIGYRESLAATPTSLRPPTFDNVGP